MAPTIACSFEDAKQLLGDVFALLTPTRVSLVCLGYLLFKGVYKVLLYPYFFSALRHIPGPSLGNPLIGRILDVVNDDTGSTQRDWHKTFGSVVRVVGPIGIERLFLLEPSKLRSIFINDWIDYPRPDFMRNILGLVTGYGLLTVTGEEHRLMRKAMNPAFSIPNLTHQAGMFYDAIEGLTSILNDSIDAERVPTQGKVFLMYEWMSKVTLDIICETAFGYRTDSIHNPNNELAKAYVDLIDQQSGPKMAVFIILVNIPFIPQAVRTNLAFKTIHLWSHIPGLKPFATLVSAMNRIKAISAEMLRTKVAEAEAVGPNDDIAKRDIMSLLVRARLADKGVMGGTAYAMSDEAMMDQVLTFLGAGHETTASGLAWTLWLLAKHPEAQQKLRDEVTPMIVSNSRPGYRDLQDLEYLNCVVMEGLRVLPPVPLTVRKTSKDQVLDGIFVPKGTMFYIPIRIINTWHEIWGPDAEEFRPARWLNLPPKYNSTFSLLSFIAGPHACIGRTMSIIEMKAVLAVLITNFEFAPAMEGQTPKPSVAITMKPDDGMPLRVTRVATKVDM